MVDADTFFLKPTEFIKNGKCLYNYGREFHLPYFIHMKKLHPGFKKVDSQKSGICHHMIFETVYLTEMFNFIEEKHSDLFIIYFLKM